MQLAIDKFNFDNWLWTDEAKDEDIKILFEGRMFRNVPSSASEAACSSIERSCF